MTATLHTFFVGKTFFNVSDDCAPTAVMAAEARVADLGPGKFVQVSSGTYVWVAEGAVTFKGDEGPAVRTSELAWNKFNRTLTGSAKALTRVGRYESVRVSSSSTGKLKTFTWSHDECVGDETVAWVYRSEDWMFLRVNND